MPMLCRTADRSLPAAAALACLLWIGWAPLVHAQGLAPLEPVDGTGRVTYFIAEGTPESAYVPGDRELATWALRTWERTIGGVIRFEPSSEEQATLRIHFVRAADGQYGEMRSLRLNGVRGAAVYVRPDVNGLGPAIAEAAKADPLLRDTIVYLTCLHELGHAVGLGHTDRYEDVMYAFGYGGDIPGFFNRYRQQLRSRDDIQRVTGLSDVDVERVRAIYSK